MVRKNERDIEHRAEALVEEAIALGRDGRRSIAWERAKPLLERLDDANVATHMIRLVNDEVLEHADAITLADAVWRMWRDDVEIVAALADQMESVSNINDLNAAPPPELIFEDIGTHLRKICEQVDEDQQFLVLEGLATVGKALGRAWDNVTERARLRLVEMRPDWWQGHYRLGLFYKTRARYADGLAANLRAAELGGADEESVIWNTGICATGAGDGETALRMWKKIGCHIEMGHFGLPEGRFPTAKVRLAERPLAERALKPGQRDPGPGTEETIWIERLSPCHGIVRSVLYAEDLGTDYGDVVLTDGAVITNHKYGDRKVPVFPHMKTLRKGNYHFYPFAGTQARAGQLMDLSDELDDDAIVYPHTEQMRFFCSGCANDPDTDHEHDEIEEHHVVEGRIAAPPSMTSQALLHQIDQAIAGASDVRILAPDLCRAAGDHARAKVEARRLAMLKG